MSRLLNVALAVLLILFSVVTTTPTAKTANETPAIPVQTDDGLDPVNLVWTGFAPASWVAQNFLGWNTPLCSEQKTLDGKAYDFTLETPNTRSQTPPCWGPRYHVRLWDMGDDPVFGQWSIGAVHHEYTKCDPLCHHVIDSWEDAELHTRATFDRGPYTVSVSNFTLNNAGLYQGVYNDGVASIIQLSNSGAYPVAFVENGLPQGTAWSVKLNGTTLSSTSNTITFVEQNGTYFYSIENLSSHYATPPSGVFQVDGNRVDIALTFSPFYYSIVFTRTGLPPNTEWSVTLGGTSQSSTSPTINFAKPVGTYRFSIEAQSGYSASPSSGTVKVAGNETLSILFSPVQTLASALSSPSFKFFASVTLGAWGLAAIIGLLFSRRRRQGSNRAETSHRSP